MRRIEKKIFGAETVELDGKAFHECTFNGSHLVFRGKEGFGFGKPIMRGAVTMEFADSAKLTLDVLGMLYRSGIPSFRQWAEHSAEVLKTGRGPAEH